MSDATLTLPSPTELGALIGDLLGREVEIGAGSPVDAPALVAVYRTDQSTLRALIAMDAAAACHCGAALTLIPAAGAQEAARGGQVPANMQENVREVLNVAAQLLNAAGRAHSTLHRVAAASELDEDEKALLEQPAQRHDLTVTVDGYGRGDVSILGA